VAYFIFVLQALCSCIKTGLERWMCGEEFSFNFFWLQLGQLLQRWSNGESRWRSEVAQMAWLFQDWGVPFHIKCPLKMFTWTNYPVKSRIVLLKAEIEDEVWRERFSIHKFLLSYRYFATIKTNLSILDERKMQLRKKLKHLLQFLPNLSTLMSANSGCNEEKNWTIFLLW
jgi:hypothetical protein